MTLPDRHPSQPVENVDALMSVEDIRSFILVMVRDWAQRRRLQLSAIYCFVLEGRINESIRYVTGRNMRKTIP